MRKNTKFLLIGIGIVLAGFILIFFLTGKGENGKSEPQLAAQEQKLQQEILYYTCGMHPSVRVTPEDYEKGNKNCPICNMDLIPVYRETQSSMAMSPGQQPEKEGLETLVRLSPRSQALAAVKTEEVQYLPLFKEILTVGEIDYDERKVANVAAWVPGRIDKLFVNFTGVTVKKGDPLVWIYSPELLITQEEYLLALETWERVKESQNEETVRGAESLIEASTKRLLLWGIRPKQIEELKQRRQASTHMTIYAPIGGTVIHKNALEGRYVKEGENLYQIADLSNLWIRADIYEYEMAWIKTGHQVEITAAAYPGEKFKGKVSFIDPYLNPKTRTVKVRIDVPNPQLRLKPGMYVNVFLRSKLDQASHGLEKIIYTCSMHPEIVSDKPGECPICGMYLVKKRRPSSSVLAVPKEAVLDTGLRKLVYVEKEPGVYAAREIEVGPEATALVAGVKQKFYVLKSGLSEGAKVVTQANFLIDSQSQITGKAEALYGGALEKKEGKESPPAKHIH